MRPLLTLADILGEKNIEKVYLKLEDSDLVPLSVDSVTAPSQGHTHNVRKKSWIWEHPGASHDNVTEYEAETKKIEWAKSRARSLRYQEEIQIVKEEMNRTLRFFLWKENDWRRRASLKVISSMEMGGEELTHEHVEGLKARSGPVVDGMLARAKAEIRDPKLLFERQKKERAETSTLRATGPVNAADGSTQKGSASKVRKGVTGQKKDSTS
ncbi:hypothetical protein NMY22_g18740 [Coprinellus aureogranulatus]|nr:hypothetical protein NMY22_g18740 [Coprinellus aureogranulatus]